MASVFSRFPEIDWITGVPTSLSYSGVPVAVGTAQCFPRDMVICGLFAPSDEQPIPMGIVQQESTFWRRHLWEKAGPIPAAYRLAGDAVLWTQFARHAELVSVTIPIGGFTLTGHNRSGQDMDRYAGEVQLYISSLGDEERRLRERLKRELRLWSKAQRLQGVRKLTRKVLDRDSYKAPVLVTHTHHDLRFEKRTMSVLG